MISKATLSEHILRSLTEQLHGYEGTICLAVSGGMDSMALLYCLADTPLLPLLHIVHVHHHLRGADADKDAEFVPEVAGQLGIPSAVLHVDTLKRSEVDKQGLEAAARAERYEALAAYAHSVQASVVCTAHTQNDQAETLLMRILRGAGIDGLMGIRERRVLSDSVLCLRPMLSVSRCDLLNVASVENWSWREDGSNVETIFLRNRVRHSILPVLIAEGGQSVLRHLAHLAAAATDASEVTNFAVHATGVPTNLPTLQRNAIGTLPAAVRRAIIRAWITHHIGATPDRAAVLRVEHCLQLRPGSRVEICNGFSVLSERDALQFEAGQPHILQPVAIQHEGTFAMSNQELLLTIRSDIPTFGSSSNYAVFDADSVTFPLTWRTWRAGDAINVLNGPGLQKVSDILTNAHVPSSQRINQTILEDASGILWLCGHRIAHRARCTEQTTRFLHVCYTSTVHRLSP